MTQPELFTDTQTDHEWPRFLDYVHTLAGAELMNRFIRLAWRIKKRGFQHYSAQAIIEQLRWHYDLKHGPDADGYKINHKWRSYLARYAEQKEPRLKDFFRKRKQGKVKRRTAILHVMDPGASVRVEAERKEAANDG